MANFKTVINKLKKTTKSVSLPYKQMHDRLANSLNTDYHQRSATQCTQHITLPLLNAN